MRMKAEARPDTTQLVEAGSERTGAVRTAGLETSLYHPIAVCKGAPM